MIIQREIKRCVFLSQEPTGGNGQTREQPEEVWLCDAPAAQRVPPVHHGEPQQSTAGCQHQVEQRLERTFIMKSASDEQTHAFMFNIYEQLKVWTHFVTLCFDYWHSNILTKGIKIIYEHIHGCLLSICRVESSKIKKKQCIITCYI